MKTDHGEIVIYETQGGKTSLKVQLEKETVWLTQAQMVELLQRDQSVISRHINNVFKECELDKKSNMQKMHIANSDKPVAFYNLDVIISVGYRVKSQYGTQFRIWATSVLKNHLIKGYTVNERRLAEKGLSEMEQTIALLSKTLERHETLTDEGRAVLEVVSRYAKSWSLILQYDEDRLELPEDRHLSIGISIDDTIHYLAKFRQELQSGKYDFKAAVLGALKETGLSMFYTSIILFFGFGVFTLSNFGSTIAMGTLVSLTLLVAMFTNLVLLPSLLLSLDKRVAVKAMEEPAFEMIDREIEPDDDLIDDIEEDKP